MEKEFATYDLSVRLKELGFNEECLCVYYTNTFTGDEGLKYKLIIGHGDIELANDLLINTQKYTNSTVVNYYVTAPLWQQAFDWLLWKLKHLSIDVIYSTAGWELIVEKEKVNQYDTKEECLEKLIELCKKN